MRTLPAPPAVRPNDYRIVTGSHGEVEGEVTDLLRDGWQLAGNLLCASSGCSTYFYQPMVKYEVVRATS